MKTEYVLMCVLFVACTALVAGGLAVMLGADIQPLQMAGSTLHGLPPAAFVAR